jgi:hypothetical protein
MKREQLPPHEHHVASAGFSKVSFNLHLRLRATPARGSCLYLARMFGTAAPSGSVVGMYNSLRNEAEC